MSLHRLLLSGLCLLAATSPAWSQIDPPPAGSTTVVVLPSSRVYTDAPGNSQYAAQFQWIQDNQVAHNIQFAVGAGDFTQDNDPSQWVEARNRLNAMMLGGVPAALATGGTDYGPGGNAATRDSNFNNGFAAVSPFFGEGTLYALQSHSPTFFEVGRTDNSSHLFSTGGRDWIVLALEPGPRDAVVTWAAGQLDAHPDRTAMILTHNYQESSGVRHDLEFYPTGPGNPHTYGFGPADVNDGQELWEELIASRSVQLVLSGQSTGGSGASRLTDVGSNGRIVHQLLSDLTELPNGGDGYLRLLRFLPDDRTVEVKTYSPTSDSLLTGADNDFVFELDGHVEADACDEVRFHAPVLYWQLERANGGTVTNLGTFGSALDGTSTAATPSEFDGTAAEVESIGSLPAMSEWTVSLWTRPNSLSDSIVFGNDRDGFNDDFMIGIAPETSAISTAQRFAVIHQDDDTNSRTIAESSVAVNTGEWAHLVVRATSEDLELWLDGAFVGASPRTGADLDLGAASVRAGRSFIAFANGFPYDGTIAEIAMFDRALSDGEIMELELGYQTRAIAVRFDESGSDLGNVTLAQTSSRSGFEGIVPIHNELGDSFFSFEEREVNPQEGVMMATVAERLPSGLRATVEVIGRDGHFATSVTRAGIVSLTEMNVSLALVYFPYRVFRGAQLTATGDLRSSGGVSASDVTKIGTGLYDVNLGVNSLTDGMLLAVGGQNNQESVACVWPKEDAQSWQLRIMDSGQNFPSGQDTAVNFVYVPYDTPGLIGGWYDGSNLVSLAGPAGNWSFTRLSTGSYELTIPGHDDTTGALILTSARRGSNATTDAPDDNLIVYEPSGSGTFLIDALDLGATNPTLQNSAFYWMFVPFADPAGQNLCEPESFGGEFCFGDGGDQAGCTSCPCGNDAPQGSVGGCLNSNGTSARLVMSGSPSESNDTLRFEVQGMNPSTFCGLNSGDNRLPSNPQNPCPGGSGVTSAVLDGLRCMGGNFLRHGTRMSAPDGSIGNTTNGWGPPNGPSGGILASSGFQAGQTRHFQGFYREFTTLGCGTGQVTTNGVTVQFLP